MVVSDTSPLNYLILVGCVNVLPQIFGQVYAPPLVLIELGHPRSPVAVRTWAASPPEWLTLKDRAYAPDFAGIWASTLNR